MRICLIDDDVAALEAIASGLREAGYDVRTALGAAAGLDLIRQGGIDAVVTDMNMPGTSGAEFITEARANWRHLPIIAISGYEEIEGRNVVETAGAMGADAVLRKPFRAYDLDQVLKASLRSRTTARQALDWT